MNRKVTSIVLALCMLLSCIAVGSFSASAVSTDDAAVAAQAEDSAGASYGLASKVEDGNILHCFNWTLAQIKAELPNIAKAGFTSVQTSPLQAHNASGAWYWLYQPLGFNIGNELGSYSDLQSLCSEADKYGIKVVVDIVANHLAGWNDGKWADNIDGNMRNSSYFHNMGACSNWDNRYDVTHKNIGMPDLNSENGDVQNIVAAMIGRYQSAGVDGFRWDAAKHIGLPSESCGFWSKMSSLGGYHYGEILDNPAGNSGDGYNSQLMAEYGKYIGVTDATYSGTITGAVRDSKTDQSNGNWVNRGVPANRVVYWGESHDTYCNNGWTNGLDQNIIDRAYAVLGAKAQSQALYLSRPFEKNHDSIMYGKKGSTHFTSTEVAAVNHFHNAMVGTKEYYTTGSNCFVVCREGGAVIVSPRGSNFEVTVPNGGGIVKSGTYTDEVSGKNWTVSGSEMRGYIGSSGIAVIYTAKPAGPSASANPGSTSYKTDTLSVTLNYDNATSGQYSVDGGSFQSFSNGQTITIGSGKAYGTTTTLQVKASNGSATSDVETYTYTKVDPSAIQMVYFDNSSYNWSNVYAYIYAGESANNGKWPGVKMTKDSTGYFALEVPENLSNGNVIFTESETATTNRYPADQEPGLPLEGTSKLFKANHQFVDYPGGSQPTTPQPVTQPVTQPQPGGSVLIGDANGSGSVTISDATVIQLHASGKQTLSGDQLTAADVNLDGSVNVTDATYVQLYLVHKASSDNHCGEWTGGGQPTTTPQPVTQPQPVTEPDGNYVYYQNTNGWSTVSAYMWNAGGEMAWPGTAMTDIGNGVFRIEIPSGMTHIIFSEGGNNQTGDLDIPGAGYIYKNGNWSKYGGGDTPTPTPQPGGNYVYYRNSNGWGSVNAYMWNAGGEMAWPGSQMEDVGNGVFRIEIPSGMTHIIFSEGGNNQTGDLDIPGAGYIYDNGNWNSYSG